MRTSGMSASAVKRITKKSPAAKKLATKKAAPSKKSSPRKRTSYNPVAPERVQALLDRLAAAYPKAECALLHRNAWELLVATVLSAQCTDARVNMVTPSLFRKFPTPADFAAAALPEIEEEIRSTGFYHNKAKSLSGAAKRLLCGVQRQGPAHDGGTADHSRRGSQDGQRGSRRSIWTGGGRGGGYACVAALAATGADQATEPKKVEQDLMQIIPRDRWIAFSHEMIQHGRLVCIARKPSVPTARWRSSAILQTRPGARTELGTAARR